MRAPSCFALDVSQPDLRKKHSGHVDPTSVHATAMENEQRAPSSEPPSAATQHMEHEWEAQKLNFYQCYIVENRTLKDATSYMAAKCGFPAS